MDIVIGAGKFTVGVKAAAGGMYVKYKFGMLAVEAAAVGVKRGAGDPTRRGRCGGGVLRSLG